MRNYITTVIEVAAVSFFGMMAGFFFAFAIDVVPAMMNLDASGYTTTQQWINRVVRDAVFGGVYFGSALLPFLASTAMLWAGERRRALAWLALAVVYFGAVFWLTRTVNVPINNELATWNPAAPPEAWTQARDAWNAANLTRTLAAASCFIMSAILLSLPRRLTRGA